MSDPDRVGRAATGEPSTGGTDARRAAREARVGRRSVPATGDRGSGTARSARHDGELRRRLDRDTLVALAEERDFLLASLADLEREHDAGDVDDTDYAELKDDYTARAASVLRALEQRAVRAGEARSGRSRRGLALTLVLVLVFAAVGGVLLARASGSRDPGEGVTGDIRLSTRDQLLQAGQLSGLANAALEDGDSEEALDLYQRAIETYQEVLEVDPDNAEALASQGWLLHNIALQSPSEQAAELDAVAVELLDDAVAAEQGYAPARIFRASLLARQGRYADAQADLRAVDADTVPSFLRSRLEGLRQSVEAGLAGSAGATTGQ